MAFSLGFGKSKTSASESSTSTTTKMDAASKKILDELTASLQKQVPTSGAEFSRDNAIADATGVVENIFTKYKQQALPQIANLMTDAGVYNATAGQNLANEAFGAATANASQVVLENVLKYAGLKQQDQQLTLSGLLQALSLQQNAVSTTTSKSQGTSSSTKFGGSLSGSLFQAAGQVGP